MNVEKNQHTLRSYIFVLWLLRSLVFHWQKSTFVEFKQTQLPPNVDRDAFRFRRIAWSVDSDGGLPITEWNDSTSNTNPTGWVAKVECVWGSDFEPYEGPQHEPGSKEGKFSTEDASETQAPLRGKISGDVNKQTEFAK